MGLEWIPGAKPRPGCEAEFLALWPKLDLHGAGYDPADWKRFDELTVSPYETLNAPRIGFDPRADEWVRQEYRKGLDSNLHYKAANISEDEFVRTLHGLYVLDLMPPCDGIPSQVSGEVSDHPLTLAFRGNLLRHCVEIIGKELLTHGCGSMLADETACYSDALLSRAELFTAEHRFALSELTEPLADAERDQIRQHLDIVVRAARWCKFWAAHGHGFIATY